MLASSLRRISFVLYGCGGVGSELLRMILASRALHAERYGVRFSAIAVCDSSGALKAGADGELSDDELKAVLECKGRGDRLSALSAAVLDTPAASEHPPQFLERIAAGCAKTVGAAGTMMVDCTATEATIPALTSSPPDKCPPYRVVCANKKPVSAAIAAFDALVNARGAAACTRYESTVGAGLPVIAALARTVGAGDPVSRIAGSFSGTLGYVMSALQQGEKYSEVVRRAKSLGYTEPDPRDDLGGVDVARKALILARTLGMRLELEDVAVEPLYPAPMADLSVADFMERLPELDDEIAAKVADATAQGGVLRYTADVDVAGGKLKVGLAVVPKESPLGTLQGTDNLVEFTTGVYPAQAPLVRRGAGAGIGATAAGVLADMLELAFTVNRE